MDFLAYLKAVRKHWWPLMSCALFTLLGMWVLYADKSNAWAVRAMFAVAGFCLFWAGYRAWLEERNKRVLLEGPVLTLKEKVLRLSHDVLEFAFSRSNAAPKVTTSVRFAGDDLPQKLDAYGLELRALKAYEKDTLGIYDYRYKRLVAETIISIKNIGLDCGSIEKYTSDLSNESNPEWAGLSYPIDDWIKEVGKQLEILANQIIEA